MAAYFLAHAVYQNYMSLYYRALGFGGARLGILGVLTAAASAPGQMLFGALADRTGQTARVLRVLLGVAAALLLLLTRVRAFAAAAVFAGLLGFFYAPVQPLGDALVLERLSRAQKPFGPVRLMGALAFALSALLFGFFLNAAGRETLVALCAAGLMALALAASLLLRGRSRSRAKARPLRLLADPRVRRMLLFALPSQITMGYFYTFYPTHFMEVPGATAALLGWSNLISALAEIPFLLLGDRVYRRFGAAPVIAAASAALGVRWLLVGLASSPAALLASQVLHGVGYIAVALSMALFLNEVAPEHLRASGQALFGCASFGVARVVGNALGALAAARVGEAGGFVCCAALCLLCAAAFLPLRRRGLCIL